MATHYTVDGLPGWTADAPGEPGTYWLAGHLSTHGAPFSFLPRMKPGMDVWLTPTEGAPVRYVTTEIDVVGLVVPNALLYGDNRSARRLVLQTCADGTRRVLVFAFAA